jgi:hypothetical protein
MAPSRGTPSMRRSSRASGSSRRSPPGPGKTSAGTGPGYA